MPKAMKPSDTKKTIQQLFSYLIPYKFSLVLILLMMTLASLAMVAGSYFLKPIINQYILPGDFAGLFRMLLLLGLIYLLGTCFSYVYSKWMLGIAQKAIYKIRKDLFSKMQSLPLSFFDGNAQGDLMSRYSNDIDNLNDALSNSFLNLISSLITFVGTLIAMLVLSPVLFPVTLLSLVVMGFSGRFLGKRSQSSFRAQQEDIGKMNAYVEEMIKGQKVVKVFCHQDQVKQEFKQKNEKLNQSATAAMLYSGFMMPSMENLSHFTYAILCMLGGLTALAGGFDIGTLVAYLQYTRQVSGPVGRATQQINTIFSALAGAERVFQMMNETPETDQGTTVLVSAKWDLDNNLQPCQENCNQWAWKTVDANGETTLRAFQGALRMDHVDFGYEEGQMVLKDISFYANPGERIAFVGSTGAGKTTITNLITRFYEHSAGSISIDGIPVEAICKKHLRKSLGMVLQDVHLFSGTIRENIRYGNPEATDKEVEDAAKLAHAHEFISYLPQGYDTLIQGDGSGLSQGERQLLSIARAAVSNPPILVLDEATSSIDTMTESLIQKGMDNLMKGRTVLVIAHRLSTVQDSEAIMVMEEGRIIERGNQESLLAQQGRYHQLYTGKVKLA